jgi:hypothetical protein
MEKLRANAVIEADAARDILHIGADALAEIGDFVDEGDLRRQKRIGRVFRQFRAAAAGEQERRAVQIERAINLLHDRLCAFVVKADDDAVGALEIVDRRAFAQKLRVGDDGEFGVRAGLANDALDLVAGADGNRRFGDDHR